jgi:hypothetical protein
MAGYLFLNQGFAAKQFICRWLDLGMIPLKSSILWPQISLSGFCQLSGPVPIFSFSPSSHHFST